VCWYRDRKKSGGVKTEGERALIPKTNDERGVTTVEYAIMLVLIALTVAIFGAGLSGSITGVFSRLIVTLSSAT